MMLSVGSFYRVHGLNVLNAETQADLGKLQTSNEEVLETLRRREAAFEHMTNKFNQEKMDSQTAKLQQKAAALVDISQKCEDGYRQTDPLRK